ncbi:MAG: zinc-ribbon domain-containing protein [Acholeplasmatales bacterium]|nr:zinc-ribbon domain-containing protein [Acholeplasmatales bacterium]
MNKKGSNNLYTWCLDNDRKNLINEFDSNKNTNLISNFSYGSSAKVWWKCSKCNHSWMATIYHRTKRNSGCPMCNGVNFAKPGINDLLTRCPEVAKEWHPTKNGNLTPNHITYKSGKKVWWICPNGHEYEARPHDRVGDGTGCPICSARRNTSFPEQALFFYIKKMYPDAISRYKDIFEHGMELDVYIPSIKTGVEYDGYNWHKSNEQHIRERKKYEICSANGISLYRIKDIKSDLWEDVANKIFWVSNTKNKNNLEFVIQEVLDWIDPEINPFTRNPLNPDFHTSVIVDFKKDELDILKYLTEIQDSLVVTRPDIAEQWDYESNGPLNPEMFSKGSNDIVWWICTKCGKSYKASINHKNRSDSRCCPECANIKRGKSFTSYKVKQVGSLKETNPILAKEFHPTKNGELTVDNITAKRFKKVWWLCSKCNYEWEASPNNRSKGVGCPHCSGRVAMPGVDDIITLKLPFMDEWDYEKNNEIDPNTLLPGSGKKAWWKCKKCGNEWLTEIRMRTIGHGCPSCGHKRR